MTYLNNKIIKFNHQDEKSPTPLESAPNFRPAVCGVCWSSVVPQGGHRRPGNLSPIVALDLSRAGRRRLADLPTCRLADLPTWSWVTIEIPIPALSSGYSSGVSSTSRRIIEGSASSRASTTLRLFPNPSSCPKVCFGVIAPHHPPPLTPPFPMETAKNQIYLEKVTINKQKLIYKHAN